jgi:ABC-type multidrug transport system fused ATPase/permease subunit
MTTNLDPFDPVDYGVWPTARRLLRLWREQWRLVVLGLGCAVAYSSISLTIPLLVARGIDRSIVHHHESLWPLLLVILALATARAGINFTRRYTTARVGIRIEARMRELLYQAYLRFPRAFYDRHPTGQVVSRATNDLYPIRYFIGWGMVQGAQSLMMILGAAVVLTIVNPLLALYTAVSMPAVGLVAWLFAHRVMPISREVQQRKGDVTEAADESVVGIEMVQAFGREDDVRERFAGKARAVRDTVIRQAGVESRHLPGLFFLPTLSVAVVLWFGGKSVVDGSLSYGEFALFIQLLLQLVWPLEALGWIVNLGQRALASAGRSFAWLENVVVLPEPTRPRRLAEGPLGIAFESVRFAYPDGNEVLGGVELQVGAGEIVAVCGPTGAGKTTLLNLLPRFYDPTAGRVLLGAAGAGVDLRDVSLADVRDAVAVVTQRPILFSVPLRENLVADNDNRSWDDVLAACRAAGVDRFADDLPNGYDTLIGERGVNLSGGQRQRVALARALLARTRVLVLDDPLSSVDTETEHLLVERLRPALEGRTVLVATQRLSTVVLADRVVLLDGGRIVEDGTPAALLRAGGRFADLFGDELVAA